MSDEAAIDWFKRENEALRSALAASREREGKLREALQIDQPWAVWHIINSLCDAVDFAFRQYDMRPDGWEAWSHNAWAGREIATKLESAALSTPSDAGMGGWLPIETAPRDGEPVLLYKVDERRSGPFTITGFWSSENEWWPCAGAYAVNPTHWMPLPQPPPASGEEKGGRE